MGRGYRRESSLLRKLSRFSTPYLMTGAAHEGVKVVKVTARYLESSKVLLERDSIAPLNIMKKVDGRVVVFPSTSPNDLRVIVCDPLRGRGEIKSN
jgi:hypothetical protein